MFGPIGRHAFRQIGHGAFGGRIRCNAGTGQGRLHAGNVDDLSPFAPDHMAGDGLAHVKDRRDIGLEQLFKCLGWKILQRGAMLHSGIVDQDINRARRAFKPVYRLAYGGMIRGIKRQLMGFCTAGLQRFRCAGQFFGVAPV